MDITNQTKQPITISLPGGKKLRLGPGKTGQISPKAASRPAIQKLVEAGTVEINQGVGNASNRPGGGGSGVKQSRRHDSSSTPRQTGDR